MLTLRHTEGGVVKFIRCYAAVRTGEEKVEGTQTVVENFESAFFDVDKALQVATFQADREVITKAVELVCASYPELRANVAKNRLLHTSYVASISPLGNRFAFSFAMSQTTLHGSGLFL